jgi:hypothetical protein
MANIRNSRRNYARPTGTITANVSTSTPTVIFGQVSSSVTITKESNPIGPKGTNNYRITSNPTAINISSTSASTSFSTILYLNAEDVSNTSSYTISVSDANYNGEGKLVVATNSYSSLPTVISASVVMVGGGGGGGSMAGALNNQAAGGGGAGGYREFSKFCLKTGESYPIRVGGGGAGGAETNGSSGNPTVFTADFTIGGGAGGRGSSLGNGLAGSSGASGSGGSANSSTSAVSVGGASSTTTMFPKIDLYTVTSGTGNTGFNGTSNNYTAAGGGGASGATPSATPSGMNGRTSSITGTSVGRAGGGGGGKRTSGSVAAVDGGGTGGGQDNFGGAGTGNTGGGGGGDSRTTGGPYTGGAGGSGIVIIRIPNTHTASFSAGVTSSLSTSVAGVNIYSVTATSTTSETVTFSAA